MARYETVSIYLEDSLMRSAHRGEHNFINLMQSVLEQSGLKVVFRLEDERPEDDDQLSLVHMKRPTGRRGLTFRRVYHYPFWQIDLTEKRWLWDVARTTFDPGSVDGKDARRFQRFWRKRLYGVDQVRPNPDGPIYVPLQGRLLNHRSFQSASPLEMLETTLRLDSRRDVITTLHPKEHYTQKERTALMRLADGNPRLTIGTNGPAGYLPHCAYVVTQNSAVAFDGFFFDRPAVLFAKIDFHHIAQSLIRQTADEAFYGVSQDRPRFAAYVYWFWQMQSINAGRADAGEKIAARFRGLGWPV